MWKCTLGAIPHKDGTFFRVWAPYHETLSVRVLFPEKTVRMKRTDSGYFEEFVPGIRPGARYFYVLPGHGELPDPASRYQPEGVHGPSEVYEIPAQIDTEWKNIPFRDYLIYELHTGTFTREGTFEGIIPQIPYLKELGITALEIMPVSQFPGERNWGYDGVFPFSPQNSYGGPHGLRQLMEALHRNGLAIVLDVVYNHLGPEGNYLSRFGPYFTDKYRTPWGDAVNFDGPFSDDVRRYFIENALYWFSEYGIDCLRLDAVHGIYDCSPKHFLRELEERVEAFSKEAGRPHYLIAESDRNDTRLITPPEQGGFGLKAQWNDDFHHALHTALTGEKDGYYEDFNGISDLVKSFRQGYVYTGQYSEFRKRKQGSPSAEIPPEKFIVFSQNHDQTGNRFHGERLSALVSEEKLRLAAASVILSPYIPLLFMGEEYAETAPFLYFVSHGDPALVAAVREGRRREFSAFELKEGAPDPEGVEAFRLSKLDPELRNKPRHNEMLEFYKTLIRLRKEIPALKDLNRAGINVSMEKTAIIIKRESSSSSILLILNFGADRLEISLPEGEWECIHGPALSKVSLFSGKIRIDPYGILILSGKE